MSTPSSSPGVSAQRYRAYYDWPKPVEFDVELPDDIDGPDDLRQFLLDEAPFAKLSAVRVEPVAPDAPVRPAGVAVSDSAPVPEGGDSRGAGAGELRAEIAETLNAELAGICATWKPSFANRAADALLAAGFRRVAEDPETPMAAVREFHEAFGVTIGGHATGDLRRLRADLLGEECGEARFALIAEDLHAIAKELADVVIVAYGSALSLGIDLDEAVALVHASNMSKLVDGKPVMRPDGKVLKGSNYQPPDMSGCVPRRAALRGGEQQ